MKSVSYLVTCISILALSACGFHLRGATVLPEVMERTEMRGTDPHSALGTQVAGVVADAGGRVVGPGERGAAVLTITGERLERRVSSVDSTGRATQYEIRYSLGATLADAGAKMLVPPQSVLVIRTLDFDSGNVLGSTSEEELLHREMQREGARQLIRQLGAALEGRGRTP